MTFLTKGGLIAKVAPTTYRATEAGRDFVVKHPAAITTSDLEAIPGYEEAWNTRAKRKEAAGGESEVSVGATATPYERIEAAFGELRETLISDVLSQLAR